MKIIAVLVLLVTSQALNTADINWTATDIAIEQAITQGIFSGCVLGVATHNTTIITKPYGTVGPKRGFYSAPITTDMKFDLGYLSQPVALNAVLMDLLEKTVIIPTNKVANLYTDFGANGKRYITIQNLLQHNSGLQASIDPLPSTGVALIKAINDLKLEYATENKTVFSQLGTIILGQVIAKMTKDTLAHAMFQILTIIGMKDTGYRPISDKLKIAPGGYTNRISWGTAYNRLAHLLDDAAGNGGIFSTVHDIIIYMQLLLNKGKMKDAFRVFDEATVQKFLTVTKYKYTNTRALGWETIPTGTCPCGKKFSPSPKSFGMSDPPSGSFIWADRVRNVTIILLANGAFPGGRTNDPTTYQAAISDTVMTALGF